MAGNGTPELSSTFSAKAMILTVALLPAPTLLTGTQVYVLSIFLHSDVKHI